MKLSASNFSLVVLYSTASNGSFNVGTTSYSRGPAFRQERIYRKLDRSKTKQLDRHWRKAEMTGSSVTAAFFVGLPRHFDHISTCFQHDAMIISSLSQALQRRPYFSPQSLDASAMRFVFPRPEIIWRFVLHKITSQLHTSSTGRVHLPLRICVPKNRMPRGCVCIG